MLGAPSVGSYERALAAAERLADEWHMAQAFDDERIEWVNDEADSDSQVKQALMLAQRNAARIVDDLRNAPVLAIDPGTTDAVVDWYAETHILEAVHTLPLPFDPVYVDTEADGRFTRATVLGRTTNSRAAPRIDADLAGFLAWTKGIDLFLAPFAQPLARWDDTHRPFSVVLFGRGGETEGELGDICIRLPNGPIRLPVGSPSTDGRWTPVMACLVVARRATRVLLWLSEVGVEPHPLVRGRYLPRSGP